MTCHNNTNLDDRSLICIMARALFLLDSQFCNMGENMHTRNDNTFSTYLRSRNWTRRRKRWRELGQCTYKEPRLLQVKVSQVVDTELQLNIRLGSRRRISISILRSVYFTGFLQTATLIYGGVYVYNTYDIQFSFSTFLACVLYDE